MGGRWVDVLQERLDTDADEPVEIWTKAGQRHHGTLIGIVHNAGTVQVLVLGWVTEIALDEIEAVGWPPDDDEEDA